MQVLSRRTKNNPVLVGEPGVGKTAVVEGLAQKIVKGEVPAMLRDKRLYAIDLGAVLASSSSPADYQEHLNKILAEASESGDVLLFADDLHAALNRGVAAGIGDAAAVMRPMLGAVAPMLGAATTQGYRDYVESDAILERCFQAVPVSEPTAAHTAEILNGLRGRYETHHRVTITDAAIAAAARLAAGSMPDRRLPAKAVELLDEAASIIRMRSSAPAPPELREHDEKISQVRRDKDSAIGAQDFQKAASLRDAEKELLAGKAALEASWTAGDMDVPAEVSAELIAEALTAMSGVPAPSTEPGAVTEAEPGTKPGRQSGTHPAEPDAPPFPPSGMNEDDREIWAMA
jgi:ATP-dependent Clp protease ATP-binding subunit ClpC